MYWEKLGRASEQIQIQCPGEGETSLTALSSDTQVLSDHLVLLEGFAALLHHAPPVLVDRRSEMVLSQDHLVLRCSSFVLL